MVPVPHPVERVTSLRNAQVAEPVQGVVARFTSAFRGHPAGVAVITADAGSGPVALTATSVSSVSATPPVVAFSVSRDSSASPTLTQADTVIIHLLADDDLPLAKLGATSNVDRFADGRLWSRLDSGEPYYRQVATRILGRVITRVSAGRGCVILAEALDVHLRAATARRPLAYHARSWHRLGEASLIR